MKNPFKPKLLLSSREFRYQKGTTNLKFVLNLDNKSEMREFKELLEKAHKDVTEEINKDIDNKPMSAFGDAGGAG